MADVLQTIQARLDDPSIPYQKVVLVVLLAVSAFESFIGYFTTASHILEYLVDTVSLWVDDDLTEQVATETVPRLGPVPEPPTGVATVPDLSRCPRHVPQVAGVRSTQADVLVDHSSRVTLGIVCPPDRPRPARLPNDNDGSFSSSRRQVDPAQGHVGFCGSRDPRRRRLRKRDV